MQTTTAAFKTMIAGNDLSFIDFRVTIAGVTYTDESPAILSIDVDRQLTTDMPDGTRLITGYPSASATIVLGGMVDATDETKTAAWLFNPNSTGSPLYRTDVLGKLVTVEAGVWLSTGVERVTIFTGTIDDNQIDGAAGTVTLTCLDYRQKLRTVPVLPAVGAQMDVPDLVLTATTRMYPGLTANWVMDTLLRANGIYQSPPARTGCVYYASMSGSAYPTIYSKTSPQQPEIYTYTYGDTMTFADGFWSNQVAASSHGPSGLLSSGLDMTSTGGCTYEYWALIPAAPAFGEHALIQLYVPSTFPYATTYRVNPADGLNDLLTMYVIFDGTNWVGFANWRGTQIPTVAGTLTLPAGWHKITARIVPNSTTNVSFRLWVDDVSIINTSGTVPATPSNFTPSVVGVDAVWPLDTVQVTSERNGVPSAAFTPTAVLDASLNPLTATVDIAGRDPWAVIQELAQAEGGVAGFDELGIFRFVNRDNINTASAVRTVSAASSLKTATVQQGLSTVANHITAPVNALGFSAYQAVWSANTVMGVQPHSTRTWTVNTDNPVISVATQCVVIPSGGVTALQPYSGYRASHNHGAEVTNLTMTVQQLGPTTIVITIYNPNPFIAFLETPPGGSYPAASDLQPALWVGGEFVLATGSNSDSTAISADAGLVADSQWPPDSEGGAATNARGEIALALAANPWRQDLDTTQAFTDDILADLYKPRPLLRNVGIVADPSLQLADRVTVIDPDGTLVNDDAYIVGIHTTITVTDWAQTVDLRMVGTPGGWILGQVGRSELAVATYV